VTRSYINTSQIDEVARGNLARFSRIIRFEYKEREREREGGRERVSAGRVSNRSRTYALIIPSDHSRAANICKGRAPEGMSPTSLPSPPPPSPSLQQQSAFARNGRTIRRELYLELIVFLSGGQDGEGREGGREGGRASRSVLSTFLISRAPCINSL